jgi:hypothetical protein
MAAVLLVATALVLLLLLLRRAFLITLMLRSEVSSFLSTLSSRPRFSRSAFALGGATGDCHIGAATATGTATATGPSVAAVSTTQL